MARSVRHRLVILIVLIVLCVGITGWDDRTGALEVYLRRVCFVSGGRLTLADLAQAAAGGGNGPAFADISLPYTAGRLSILPPRSVREALGRSSSDSIILVGQRVFVLPSELIAPENAWFFEALLDSLSTQLPIANARIEVEIAGTPVLPSAREEKLVFTLGSAALRNGLKVGPARLDYRGIDPRSFASGSLGITIHVFAPVAAPRKAIRGGERFREDVLVSREVDLAGCGEDVLFFDRAAGSFTASALLNAGEPIPLRKISRTLFVRAGDRVAITFTRKNVTVALNGRALASGSLDETVTVKPDNSDRRFEGRVTGDKEVCIELQ
jgi:flagella basal body P-ring formation protein FlgA